LKENIGSSVSKFISKKKLLSHEEEITLAKLKDNGDNEARNKLIEHNFKLVLSIANRYKKYGIEPEELFAEGNLGLIKGVDKYDWSKGFRLSTYATWWISQSISKFVMDNTGSIRTPVYVQELSRKVAELIKEQEKETGKIPSAEEISKELEIDESLVNNILNQNLNHYSHQNNDTNNQINFENIIEDKALFSPIENINRDEMREIIKSSFDKSSDIEKTIFNLRFGFQEENK